MNCYHPMIRFTSDVFLLKPNPSPYNVLSSVRVDITDDYMSMREELGKIGIDSPQFMFTSEDLYDIIREYKDDIRSIMPKSFINNRFVRVDCNTIVKIPDTVSIVMFIGNDNKFAGMLSNIAGMIGSSGIKISYPTYKNQQPIIITNCILYINLIDILNMLLRFDTQNIGLLLLDLDPKIELDTIYRKYRVKDYESCCECDKLDDSIPDPRLIYPNENLHSTKSKDVYIYRCKLTDAINTHIGGNNIAYLKFTNNLPHVSNQIPIYITTSGKITDSDQVLADIVIDDHSSNVISDILVSASADELIINICKNAIGSIFDLELISRYEVPTK